MLLQQQAQAFSNGTNIILFGEMKKRRNNFFAHFVTFPFLFTSFYFVYLETSFDS